MLKVTVRLTGVSPISFSRAIQSEKDTGESHDHFELRTWQERLHTDEKGMVFIPPMALKNCLSEVAKFLGESVPGKGKATYTKHFEAGLLVVEPINLDVKGKDVKPNKMFVPADGRRGSGKRVWKYFPTLPAGWTGIAEIFVLDPILIGKPEKIEEYLIHAGKFIGLGSFRPRNNGFFGRFEVSEFKAVEVK